jgi:hypothetical protein
MKVEKGSGICTYAYKGGDKLTDSWEKGSAPQRIRRHWQNTKTPVAAAPTPLSGLVLVSLSINRPLKGMP